MHQLVHLWCWKLCPFQTSLYDFLPCLLFGHYALKNSRGEVLIKLNDKITIVSFKLWLLFINNSIHVKNIVLIQNAVEDSFKLRAIFRVMKLKLFYWTITSILILVITTITKLLIQFYIIVSIKSELWSIRYIHILNLSFLIIAFIKLINLLERSDDVS